ncbi:MAG TPA: choice-of-anchor tandem repeat GloVer-containing protein [Rhizomicrobium sp.]
MLRCLGSKFVLSTFLALAALALPGSSQAKFRVLYTFKGGSDGSGPVASLIRDAAGNLYGTTEYGGTSGFGTVFRFAPDGTETVLYSFAGGEDGAYPAAALIMDGSGNFYGTTVGGGNGGCEGEGCGTVFKLAPDGTETVLHAFAGGSDGSGPAAGLIMDISGDLYGTTAAGGGTGCYSYGCGTVFKLAPDGAETVLYAFQGGSDGGNPSAGLIADKSGNLYGTTQYGGTGGIVSAGTVFEVTPDGQEKVLWDFCSKDSCEDGEFPVAGLIRDKAGNLYGTTTWGGIVGTAFKLAPDGTLATLHGFTDDPDGANPFGGLVMDKAGNLYGTTESGGKECGDYGSSCGIVFRIAPDGTETVLHAFRKGKGDGILPQAGLVKDGRGNLYGTTPTLTWHSGGGTIFEITP